MRASTDKQGANTAPAVDALTVLQCHSNLRLAKRIHADGRVDHYDKTATYSMQGYALPNGLDSMERLLRKITTDPSRCVVRGGLNPVAFGDAKFVKGVRRKKKDDGATLASLVETPRYWVALDVDDAPMPEGTEVSDLPGCVRDVIAQLSPEFHGADYIVQASARHGLTPGIRVRLWYWLSRPLGEKQLKGWFADAPVDRAIFNAAQVIYTAAPVFGDGAADHLPERLVHVRQGQPVVQVPEELPEIKPDAKPGDRGYMPTFTPTDDADAEKALAEAAEYVRTQKAGNRHTAVLAVTAILARRFIVHGRLPREQVQTEIALALTEAGRAQTEAIDEVQRALNGILESLQHDAEEFLKHPPSDEGTDQTGGTAENQAGTEGAKEPPPVCDAIDQLNADYMVVNEAGKAVVYSPRQDPILNRCYYDRSTFEDFKKLYMNEYVRFTDAQGNVKRRRLGDVWLDSPRRRQYTRGVVFDPSRRGAPPGMLNLWEGFSFDSKPGDWSLLRSHISDVICCRNQEHFEYLMGWMARMVQHPAQQGEVAVVLKGGEGTGKGTLARALIRIFGQHGLAISQAKHLVGNFNSHLRDCVFLFADEAFFAGDKQHLGVLKSIITEPYLTIEAKFQNAVQMPSFLHVMMASNEDWVVPASLDSRRFFVLNVSEDRKCDIPYFRALWAQMDSGGYEAMLHDLQAYDLTSFDLRNIPVTAALQEQRVRSLPTFDAWWLDVLQRGYVGPAKQWQDEVDTEMLVASYTEFAKQRNERHVLARNIFGKRMTGTGAIGGRLSTGTRPSGYKLGSLAAAREAFIRATQLTGIEWPPNADSDHASGTRLEDIL